jgi:branched-chain amino acid aminotransferase
MTTQGSVSAVNRKTTLVKGAEMSEFVVYVNGKYVPETEAVVSVFDRGFLIGDSAYDTTRTFRHIPFKLDRHIERLFKSLKYAAIDLGLSKEDVTQIALEVLRRNSRLLNPDEDYYLSLRVSRGRQSYGRAILTCKEPTLVVYLEPLPFRNYAHLYAEGARLVTPSIRRTPPECISPRGKLGNKVNHTLAELEVKQTDPGCFVPLMLDVYGFVSETDAGNFFIASKGELITPDRQMVLEGITRETVFELASSLGIGCSEGRLTLYDVYTADEAFITATSYCVLPVTKVNGRVVGTGVPGPVTKSLLQGWNKLAGLDVVAQAVKHP